MPLTGAQTQGVQLHHVSSQSRALGTGKGHDELQLLASVLQVLTGQCELRQARKRGGALVVRRLRAVSLQARGQGLSGKAAWLPPLALLGLDTHTLSSSLIMNAGSAQERLAAQRRQKQERMRADV